MENDPVKQLVAQVVDDAKKNAGRLGTDLCDVVGDLGLHTQVEGDLWRQVGRLSLITTVSLRNLVMGCEAQTRGQVVASAAEVALLAIAIGRALQAPMDELLAHGVSCTARVLREDRFDAEEASREVDRILARHDRLMGRKDGGVAGTTKSDT